MGSPISYADPAVGAIFASLEVPERDLAKIVGDAQAHPDGFPARLKSYVWGRFPGLLSHEWAHVLQVANYPLLHLRAARQALLAANRFRTAATRQTPVELPVLWYVDDEWRLGSLIETIPIRITVEHD